MGFFSKISEGLKKTRDSFAKKVEAITNSFTTIDDDLMDELEETLILSDVGVTTSQHIVEALRRRIKERGVTDAREVKGLLKEIIAEMLEGGQELNLST